MMVAEEDPHANDSKNKVAENIAEASTVTADDDEKSTKSSSSKEAPAGTVPATFGRIIGLVKPEIPFLILAIILMLLAEAGNLAVPYILARAYDALQGYFFELGVFSMEGNNENVDENVARATMAEINRWMGTSIGVFVIANLFRWARTVILAVIGERLVARLRLRLYDSVLKQEIGFYDENKTGEIVSRLGSDTQLFQTMISTFAPEAFQSILTVIISLILMYSINAKLTSMTLGGLLFLCIIAIPFGQKLSKLSKLYQDVLGEAQTRSTEALGSIRTVQSFAAESKELNRYQEKIGDPNIPRDKKILDTYNVGIRKALTQVGVITVVFAGAFGWLYCTLWYGFHLVTIEGTLSLGGLSAFQSYVFIIGGGIAQTVTNVTQVVTAIGASGRVFYLLERKPNIKNFDGISDDEEELDSEDEKDNTDSSAKKKKPRSSASPSFLPNPWKETLNSTTSCFPTRPDRTSWSSTHSA